MCLIQRLSESQRSWLWDATQRYRASLPGSPGEEYLTQRGLNRPEASPYGLGYVAEPLAGHELFRGWLAIPYMRWSPWRKWSVATIRFRCLEDHDHQGHGKYMTLADDKPRLYNTHALTEHHDRVAITEGEIDAITAELCGIPTVGVPGVQTWKPYFRELFLGYKEVLLLADGDQPGLEFAQKVAKSLPNSKIIPMPPTEDVNSFVISQGKQALLERIK